MLMIKMINREMLMIKKVMKVMMLFVWITIRLKLMNIRVGLMIALIDVIR